MKKVNPSKLMKERARKIVEVIICNSATPEEIELATELLAEMLEMPTVNNVDKKKYAQMFETVFYAIVTNVVKHEMIDNMYNCVLKTKRVLSPEVRAERYAKAVEQLKEKYGIKGE